MVSRDDYSVGWVCALPIEVKAARGALDRMLVGIAGGVPDSKEDIRLGDVVVSRSTPTWPGIVQYSVNAEKAEAQFVRGGASDQPAPSLLAATSKTETAAIFGESRIPQYIDELVQKDPVTFTHPGPEQDVLFESSYEHTDVMSEDDGCNHCNPNMIQPRQPRETQDPTIHYGVIAAGHHLICTSVMKQKLVHEQDILCLDTEVAGLKDAAQYLAIRGICDYADSHSSKVWHAYAAVAAAAYAKEVLSFIPTAPKTVPLAINTYAEAAPVLDALLLARPEVDRRSLIALKGRRVDGTCEWLIQHPIYQAWLAAADRQLLWISGGPGKGKTMLAIYLTEVLKPTVDAADRVLLYYFCSNRDKNRNTALTVMRGIIHQWIDLHPNLAPHVKSSFEGTETTKYTVSNFASLWGVFMTLLEHSASSQVVCVLDGLDECEKDSLRQLLDAVGKYLASAQEDSRLQLKLILLSRSQPAILESKLSQYQQRYIFSKVAELAAEQTLTEEMAAHVQQALLAGADDTFLWVAFVANELQGRNWKQIQEIFHRVPKGLGGIYQRLLQQVNDKEALVPILQWIVLAARPLTLDELAVATGIKPSGNLPATQVIRHRLRSCGLLVKIEGDVVNLVHESAKEFFQSDQVNAKGTSMFRMTQDTHRTLMQVCLTHVEHGYGSSARSHPSSNRDPLLPYASQYWPVHFHHAMEVMDASAEFSRPFFRVDSPIQNGGNPPSFKLLHLAAYLGNTAWAKWLLSEHARLISRKDNYGLTPLSWAASRGHRDMVEFLLDHGARVNVKDRTRLTALHIAVTGQHKSIVCMLLDRGARLQDWSEHGDTPLIRAIQGNSTEIIQILLEHGARVDYLPTPPGAPPLKGPSEPLEERASRKVDLVMKTLDLSFRFPIILRLMTLYLKFIAFDRSILAPLSITCPAES
ncbi:hypothetical protein LCI18_009963 [Fusarium solani-melongenae]|uniref:Uncharacterized protein n=1 Tax=Fusarium solani subsp. cucurbitae TaxID=2747967 RepID=A0ACD3ZD92_FUSSC|nr:hypothetical protein LCI18_009963 [Fusarium solani-melongenae]